MHLILEDLMEVEYKFACDFEGDGVESWDYSFSARCATDMYCTRLSAIYIEQLRENCKAILKATEGVENEY